MLEGGTSTVWKQHVPSEMHRNSLAEQTNVCLGIPTPLESLGGGREGKQQGRKDQLCVVERRAVCCSLAHLMLIGGKLVLRGLEG